MGAVGCEQCSCITPVGSNIKQKTKMAGFSKVCLLLLVATSALGQRAGKNLRGTFPFNSRNSNNAAHHDHHGHHEEHHAHHNVDDTRDARQRGRGGGDVVTCKHSYSEKCHTTYTTDFEPQQEEDCEENFVKSCFIEYKKVASEEAVTFCHTPILLEGDGEEVCQTVYESACTTRYQEHDVQDDVVECETIQEEKCEDVTQGYTTEQKCTKWPVQKCKTSAGKVKKYSPETECKKVPREICGAGTTQVPGEEECFDRKETVIQEVPEETCNLEPQRICKHVTKLVPLLKPVEECVDIPKEVCSRSRTNLRKVQKPVVKKWCYVPTAQSGLA